MMIIIPEVFVEYPIPKSVTYRQYILATKAKIHPGKNQPEIPHGHRIYTTVVGLRAPTMADFVDLVEKI